MSGPRREGEGAGGARPAHPGARGGRAVGAAGASAASRVRPRDRGWRAGRPLTAGPGQALGTWPRAPPPRAAGGRRGEGNRRTTKKLATGAGRRSAHRPRIGGQRSRGAGVTSTLSPPIPSSRWGLGGRAPGRDAARSLSRSQPGTDVPSPRAACPCPLIIGFVTGAITALPRAWFRVACFSSLRG